MRKIINKLLQNGKNCYIICKTKQIEARFLKVAFLKVIRLLTEKAKGSTAEIRHACAVKSEEGWYVSEHVTYCHESGVLSGKILRRKCFFMTVLYARSFLFF